MSQVARTILQQLGGKRFLVMTGARNLLSGERSLSMALPTGNRAGVVNMCRIVLADNDTYTVEGWRRRGTDIRLLDTRSGIMVDNLRQTFESMTGLLTSL